MRNRGIGFVSLLAVIGVSIVFGMVIGGRLNAPPVAHASPPGDAVLLAPAATAGAGMRDFADVVESALPAVVRVTSSALPESSDEEEGGEDFERELFRWFFDRQNTPRPSPQRDRPRVGEGSGFVISRDGYILTNNHVVDGADRVEIALQSGREFAADVVGTDPSIDLALLKIDSGREPLPHLALGDSERLRVGQWVIAIGNPLEFEHTVTVGVLSAKERRIPIGNTDSGVVSFLQTDAAINFGNSGGPLLDADGNVVGINTAIRREGMAEGIGFALPINHARSVIEQLRERGFVKRGYIGIDMHPNGIDEAARDYYGLPDTLGVIVEDVRADGPADKAGLRRFDIIRKVDGSVVRDNLDMIGKISSHQPGDKIRLEVLRKGKKLEFDAVLGDREEGLRVARGGGPSTPDEREQEGSSGLGITVENLTPRVRDQLELRRGQGGVLVTEVDFTSDAADKGIIPNMLLTDVNEFEIDNVADWESALESLEPGTAVKLAGLVRNVRGEWQSFSIYLRVPRD